MGGEQISWSGQSWRLPAWLWLSLAAMAAATLHIVIDFGVGLFDLHGRLSAAEAGTLVGVALIHVWWVVSLVAGSHGRGGGIASAAVLALGWTLMTNGFPIVYCPPTCSEAAPLSDVAHVGSIALGAIAAVVCLWTLWRARPRTGWVLPLGALLLVFVTVFSLSQAGPS